MKKVLSVMAVSAFVLTAGVALAGGGKKMGPGCPEACQQQIDDLNSSQAQQNEQLSAHGKQLKNHEGRITALEKAFDDYWYARLGLRAAWLEGEAFGDGHPVVEWDADTGFGGAFAFGREFAMYNAPGRFRGEVEFAYQGADLDEMTAAAAHPGVTFGGEYTLMTVMVNGYYELPIVDAFSVYAMAGVGYAKLDVDMDANGAHIMGGSDNVFAYKAGAGITYNFTNEIAGDLGYEYLGVADTDIAESINGHNVVASVRFKF